MISYFILASYGMIIGKASRVRRKKKEGSPIQPSEQGQRSVELASRDKKVEVVMLVGENRGDTGISLSVHNQAGWQRCSKWDW